MTESNAPARKNITAALLEAQKDMPKMTKSGKAKIKLKTGGEYAYDYVTLDEILDKCVKKLNEHGIVLYQYLESAAPGAPMLWTVLSHPESGEEISNGFRLPESAGGDIKGLGSTITYGRRYAITPLLALSTEDDDDAHRGDATREDAKKARNLDDYAPPPEPPKKQPLVATASKDEVDSLKSLAQNLLAEEWVTEDHLKRATGSQGDWAANLSTLPRPAVLDLTKRLTALHEEKMSEALKDMA